MPKRLARKPSTASLMAAARNSRNARRNLPGGDRPDDHRHEQDARQRDEIRNTQTVSPGSPARRLMIPARRAWRFRLSISAIEPLHTLRFRHSAEGMSKKGLTYAQSGVDIDAGNRMVELIKPLVKATARPGADAEIGGFGGLFDLKRAGFKDPVLVAANDGVGTKVKIAIETGIHDTIGIDLVAMSVNDLVVQGAEPLFFLDYFASGKLDPEDRRRDRRRHRRRLPAGRLRADRRRDRGDAGRLSRRRLRPRGLCGRRRRARRDPAARRHSRRRRRARHRLVRRAFQRLFAGAQGRRADRS